MLKLRLTYDGRPIYATSYERRKVFLRHERFTCKIVRSSEIVFENCLMIFLREILARRKSSLRLTENTDKPQRFYSNIPVNRRQPAPPVKKWRILVVQSFTAHMPLLTATSAFGLGRRRWSSPRQCYLQCLLVSIL